MNDQVIIYPTDTVWGLGASVYSQKAYDHIAIIKNTNHTKPLSIMFSSVEMINEYFSLAPFMNEAWLKEFFKLESTLGLPTSFLKKELPKWLVEKSPIISIRFVESAIIKEVGEIFKTPFFSTSLNLTTQAPITSYKDAVAFKELYAKELLLLGDSAHELSGESSTIVFYYPLEAQKFKFIRTGRFLEQIKKLLLIT